MKTEQVHKDKMKDRDSFNIVYELIFNGRLILSLDGHYNVRTNFVHLNFTEHDEDIAKSFEVDLNELDNRIESREIEIE